VPLRLAHGGSSAALKSDPFGQVDAYAAKMRAAYKKLSEGKEPKVESQARANGLRMGSSG
jgi:hypothetical protein